MAYTITGKWIPEASELGSCTLPPVSPLAPIFPPNRPPAYRPDVHPISLLSCPHCMYSGPMTGYNFNTTVKVKWFKRISAILGFIMGVFTVPWGLGIFIMIGAVMVYNDSKIKLTTFTAFCPQCNNEMEARYL